MPKQNNWSFTVIRPLSPGMSAVSGMNSRMTTAGSFADAVAAISEAAYASSLRHQVVRGLQEPRVQKEIERLQTKDPSHGVLMIVKYVVTQTSSGPRYSEIHVSAGPSAKTAQNAIQAFRNQGYIYPSPSGPGKIAFDYLWFTPYSTGVTRVFEQSIPNDLCIVSGGRFQTNN